MLLVSFAERFFRMPVDLSMSRIPDLLGKDKAPVSLIEKLISSEAFASFYHEGMGLVEEAAAYLDGEGREEAKSLTRESSLAYSAESMRLTTRLMQIASWLLLQRSVQQGEMTRHQSTAGRHRVKLQQQELASSPETFKCLPGRLRELSLDSLRLQARIILMDQLLYAECEISEKLEPPISPVLMQLARLRDAFSD